MQLSQTVSSAIAQFKVLNSQITNHTKKDLAPVPSSFFQFLYNLKINLLWIVYGGGFSDSILPLAAVVVERRV